MPPRHSRHSRAAPEPHARAGGGTGAPSGADPRLPRRLPGVAAGRACGMDESQATVEGRSATFRTAAGREDPSVALPVPRPLPARRAAGPGSASGSAHVETKVPAFYVRMKRCTLSKLARQIPVRYRYSCTGTGNRIRYSTGTGILFAKLCLGGYGP